MNRTVLSLAVVSGVLVLGVGAGAVVQPGDGRADGQSGERRVPVQSAVGVCPNPVSDGVSQSWVGVASPPAGATTGSATTGAAGTAPDGEAAVTDLGSARKVSLRVSKRGVAAGKLLEGVVPPQVGRARGSVAPGFSLQQTTLTSSGISRGLSSAACVSPGTNFWFAGTSTTPQRRSGMYLTNSEQVPATVDLLLYGPKGPIDAPGGRNLLIGPGRQRLVLLGALAPGVTDLGVNVVVRAGRVAAALRDQEVAGKSPKGVDWLPPAADPVRQMVLPPAPGGSQQRLYLLAPGDDSGSAQVRLIAKGGSFTPVGAESVQLTGGRMAAVDISAASRGEPVAVSVNSEVPVLAGLRVVRPGRENETDVGFLASTTPIVNEALVADSRSGSAASAKLYLTAPGKKVKVTVSTLGAGVPRAEDVVVPAGTTVTLLPKPPPAAAALGYAVVVTPQEGQGPLYGSWAEFLQSSGGELFTTQPLVDDAATVVVPRVGHDLSAGINRVN